MAANQLHADGRPLLYVKVPALGPALQHGQPPGPPPGPPPPAPPQNGPAGGNDGNDGDGDNGHVAAQHPAPGMGQGAGGVGIAAAVVPAGGGGGAQQNQRSGVVMHAVNTRSRAAAQQTAVAPGVPCHLLPAPAQALVRRLASDYHAGHRRAASQGQTSAALDHQQPTIAATAVEVSHAAPTALEQPSTNRPMSATAEAPVRVCGRNEPNGGKPVASSAQSKQGALQDDRLAEFLATARTSLLGRDVTAQYELEKENGHTGNGEQAELRIWIQTLQGLLVPRLPDSGSDTETATSMPAPIKRVRNRQCRFDINDLSPGSSQSENGNSSK